MRLALKVVSFVDRAICKDLDTLALLDFAGQTYFPLAEVDTCFHFLQWFLFYFAKQIVELEQFELWIIINEIFQLSPCIERLQ